MLNILIWLFIGAMIGTVVSIKLMGWTPQHRHDGGLFWWTVVCSAVFWPLVLVACAFYVPITKLSDWLQKEDNPSK